MTVVNSDITNDPKNYEEAYPTDSTYRAPVTVKDVHDEERVDLRPAEIVVKITSTQGGGEELLFVADDGSTDSDTDAIIEDVDRENGEVALEIPPSEVTWTGVVWEEWRITFPTESRSGVVNQRDVEFRL